MQIYITKEREKQLRDYAKKHAVSMSSVIDKSLEQYIVKSRTVEVIPPKVSSNVIITPVAKKSMEFEL